MPQGTVTYFDDEKGFGFIETGATKDNVFFHIQKLDANSIAEGDMISFDIEPPNDRDENPKAINPKKKS